jgi:predicted metal-binding membrane protein
MASDAAARRASSQALALLCFAIVAAWIVCALVELSGGAAQLHHHALYESQRPYWLAALMVVASWQFMTAAMMLPSSLGFIRMYGVTAANAPNFPAALTLFLAAYFAVWTAFALAAFAGDMQLHRLVDGWPWLSAHSNVILAATLALAAVFQLTPLKDACLRACRHPGLYLARHYQRGAMNGLRLGFGHATYCLGCCWALMLVMFAAGVAHLAWMGVLGLIMFVEKGVRGGERIVVPVSIFFFALAVVALALPGAIPGL